MSQSIQYIVLAKDVEHWNADVKREFGRALGHYLAVAFHATAADETLSNAVRAFRVESLAEVLRQITAVVNSTATHVDLKNDILHDTELMSLIDTCIECAFQQTQHSSRPSFVPDRPSCTDETQIDNR